MSLDCRSKGRCLVVAEAGVNHNGSLAIAQKMVRAAAVAGADFVKFQVFSPTELTTPSAPKAGYQKRTTGSAEKQQAMLAKLVLGPAQFRVLARTCRKKGIGFLATAFDHGSLAFVESLRPAFHKVSSGDLDNYPYLRQVARYRRPVILSTGMGTMEEVKAALRVLEQAGLPRSRVIVLQCHTEYPSRPSETNLRAMDTIRKQAGVRVGLSDHVEGIGIALAAVARGACLVEKHFTINRKMKGPDHKASLVPRDLALLVKGIRAVEEALGDGIKRPSTREMGMRRIVRKQLVARRRILKGEKFSPANLALKRAGGGIPASRWDHWIGRRAPRNYGPEEKILP
jgi:N-acetylneuraminate synthase